MTRQRVQKLKFQYNRNRPEVETKSTILTTEGSTIKNIQNPKFKLFKIKIKQVKILHRPISVSFVYFIYLSCYESGQADPVFCPIEPFAPVYANNPGYDQVGY